MKVLLLTRYGRLGASSRVRSLQYVPFLESMGWNVDVAPLFPDSYLEAFYEKRSRWSQVISGYWRRLKDLAGARDYDLIWIEKEVFPFMPAWIETLLSAIGMPYMVDYDDALFHRYDKHRSLAVRSMLGGKIDSVMRHSELVIAGNEYLASRARCAGAKRVEVIPTVVDFERYCVSEHEENYPLTVGWIGTPQTSRYIKEIFPALESVALDFSIRVVLVGASVNDEIGFPIEFWPWTEETEVASIKAFDIGVMPLPNQPWERGKCGYKLIQYMACGLPVVASPVGVNENLVEQRVNGFLAADRYEWEQALRYLLSEQEARQRMGARGRQLVENWYSLQVQAPRLHALMREVLFDSNV